MAQRQKPDEDEQQVTRERRAEKRQDADSRGTGIKAGEGSDPMMGRSPIARPPATVAPFESERDTNLNVDPGSKWKQEGEIEAALSEFAGVGTYQDVSSITKHETNVAIPKEGGPDSQRDY